MYVISVKNKTRLYGPFTTVNEALIWAQEKEALFLDWEVLDLHNPEDPCCEYCFEKLS